MEPPPPTPSGKPSLERGGPDLALQRLRRVEVVAPLPGRGLSPNRVGHRDWKERNRANKLHREEVYLAALAAKGLGFGEPMQFAELQVRFEFSRVGGQTDDGYRPLDILNGLAAIKAAADSLIHAGLIVDDSHHHLSLGHCAIIERKQFCTPRLVLTLKELRSLRELHQEQRDERDAT